MFHRSFKKSFLHWWRQKQKPILIKQLCINLLSKWVRDSSLDILTRVIDRFMTLILTISWDISYGRSVMILFLKHFFSSIDGAKAKTYSHKVIAIVHWSPQQMRGGFYYENAYIQSHGTFRYAEMLWFCFSIDGARNKNLLCIDLQSKLVRDSSLDIQSHGTLYILQK